MLSSVAVILYGKVALFEFGVINEVFGLDRTEVRRIAEHWPDWVDEHEQNLAINNALNNLLGYPHDQWDVWHDYISPIAAEVEHVFARFRAGRKPNGSPLFDHYYLK